MQRLEVVFAAEACADIDDLFSLLVKLGAYPLAAAGFIDRVVARCERIGNAPRGGRRRDDLKPNLRMVGMERRVVIIYQVMDETVSIERIFYGGSDYEKVFDGSSI